MQTKKYKCITMLQGLQFSDKDEHMYFWFPLLAGLSELTFDPRPDIRYSALEVLFDTLKFHGSAFTLPFWTRIFDSVLLPIFDHVRAEVRDCMAKLCGRCILTPARSYTVVHVCCSCPVACLHSPSLFDCSSCCTFSVSQSGNLERDLMRCMYAGY